MNANVLLHDEPVHTLDEYLERGGGTGLERALELGPARTVDELTQSGLRGRGGGGFPTGRKWSSVLGGPPGTRYAVCNAGEGEPGTFKDRAILRNDPYQVLEGLAIAAHTVGASETFIGLKASFEREYDAITRAVVEMEQAGLLDNLTVTIVPGPEEYLFGEEKAMLEVIEGNDPLPRWLPPYLHGLFVVTPQLGWEPHSGDVIAGANDGGGEASNPTLVNNVETLACVTHVLARGGDWFRSMGTPESPGPIVCTVVGDVERAGVVEVELGTSLADVLDLCGGCPPGRRVKAVLPGVSNAALPGTALDTPVSYEGFAAAGSGLGSAGFVVYDDTACMLEVACVLARFLYVESCGQCPPCKLGTGAIARTLAHISAGNADEEDTAQLEHWLANVADANRCALPVEAQNLVPSLLAGFPEDVAAHLEGRCELRHDVAVPKLVDIIDGRARYDERQARKRPDWTYAP